LLAIFFITGKGKVMQQKNSFLGLINADYWRKKPSGKPGKKG
jgi:hypothetical protein